MLSRKINAVFSLLCTFLLMAHAIFHAVWMLSRGSIEKAANASIISWILFGVMIIHAYISIDLAISAHTGTEKRKCKSYPKMNIPTIIQRASGVSLILFAVLHVLGTIGVLQPPQVVHAILPALFFTIALLHTAISTPKALITLGIGNVKLVKAADIAVKVLCGVTLIADITGFYLYLV